MTVHTHVWHMKLPWTWLQRWYSLYSPDQYICAPWIWQMILLVGCRTSARKKDDRRKKISNQAWNRDLCSTVKFHPHKPCNWSHSFISPHPICAKERDWFCGLLVLLLLSPFSWAVMSCSLQAYSYYIPAYKHCCWLLENPTLLPMTLNLATANHITEPGAINVHTSCSIKGLYSHR